MDGQHQYEINLKKDDLFICLLSDDVYFISKQMDKWFRILLDDSYVPVNLPPWPQPAGESQPIAEPQPQVHPQMQPQVALPAPVEPLPIVQPLPMTEPMPQPVLQAPPALPQAPIPEAAYSQPVQGQIIAPQPASAIPQPTPQSNQVLAEQIMSMTPAQPEMATAPVQPTLQDVLTQVGQPNLPDFVPQQAPAPQSVLSAMPQQPEAYAHQNVNLPLAHQAPMQTQQAQMASQPLPQMPEPAMQPAVQAPAQPQMQPQPQAMPQAAPPQLVAVGSPSLVPSGEQDDFEAVMNSLLSDFDDKAPAEEVSYPAVSPGRQRIEPDLSGITSLADLCDRSNAANSEDYLLLSAYYLTRMERQETFSLKKVNSILVKSGLTPVNHSVLETVLSNGYLSMVPDLTGMADVTEYKISNEGLDAGMALL
jgi:hypothetical protein